MKLKLGQIRFLMAVSAALALLLFPLGVALDNTVIFYLGLGCFTLTVYIWLFHYKCPHCKKRIGRSTSLRCPHCGQKL